MPQQAKMVLAANTIGDFKSFLRDPSTYETDTYLQCPLQSLPESLCNARDDKLKALHTAWRERLGTQRSQNVVRDRELYHAFNTHEIPTKWKKITLSELFFNFLVDTKLVADVDRKLDSNITDDSGRIEVHKLFRANGHNMNQAC